MCNALGAARAHNRAHTFINIIKSKIRFQKMKILRFVSFLRRIYLISKPRSIDFSVVSETKIEIKMKVTLIVGRHCDELVHGQVKKKSIQIETKAEIKREERENKCEISIDRDDKSSNNLPKSKYLYC